MINYKQQITFYLLLCCWNFPNTCYSLAWQHNHFLKNHILLSPPKYYFYYIPLQHLSEHPITELEHLSLCKHTSVAFSLPLLLAASLRLHGPKSEGDQLIIPPAPRQNR